MIVDNLFFIVNKMDYYVYNYVTNVDKFPSFVDNYR